jgi:hypothetical protein
MKKIILCWLVILGIVTFFTSQVCYADKVIEVKTGYGYFTDSQGHIIGKATLPSGKHPLWGNKDYVEVNSKEELDAIQVYIPPIPKEEQDRVDKEKFIQTKIREQAITALKVEGKLDSKGDIVK